MAQEIRQQGIANALVLFTHSEDLIGHEAVLLFRKTLESLDTLANEQERQHTRALLDRINEAVVTIEVGNGFTQ